MKYNIKEPNKKIVVGHYHTSYGNIRKDLKEEMHRYNSVLARLAVAENSIKSCHNRIDTLEERL